MMKPNMSGLKLNELMFLDGAGEHLLPTSHTDHPKPIEDKSGSISFSDALGKTGFGKFNIFLIFIAGMVLANVLLETSTMGFILPVSQCDLNLTNQDKGILSAIGFAGIIVSSHLWGFLADTKGRRKIIRPTLLAAFAVTLFSSLSHTFWVMVVLRFINGFFVSGGSATIYAYLGELHTDKTRSRAMMGSAFIFAIGAMIVPFIAFMIINREWILPLPLLGIDFKPWRLFMVVCGIPGFLCGLSLFFLPESPKFLLSIGKEDEVMEILQKIHRWNGGKEKLEFKHILPEEDITTPVTQISDSDAKNSNLIMAFLRTMWNQTAPLFQRKYLRITLIVCTLQFWLYVVTNGMYMWFPTIINDMASFMNEHPGEHKQICQIVYDKHETLYKTDGTMECITKLENHTYLYSLTMEILYAVTFAFIGVVINRVGKIPVLFISMIFFTSCGLTAVLISDPSIAAYLYVLFFLVGVAINVLGAATVDLYPTHLRGMAICISLMMGRTGSVVGANVNGALLSTNCELTFYISCGALFACAFLALLLPRKGLTEEPEKRSVEDS